MGNLSIFPLSLPKFLLAFVTRKIFPVHTVLDCLTYLECLLQIFVQCPIQ